ncbi:MAG TPA: polysaccharide pyruvyl transferase family protein, partial [Bellilinea sp.]|nr:polysaccharide pyruvyl transferase family protein [Bellilinea sp.]
MSGFEPFINKADFTMRFLVRNAGFVNKGAEAMLKTVKDQLSRRIPNSQFALERGDIGGGLESMAEAAGFEIVDRHVGHVSSKVDLAIQMVFAPREVAQIYRERSGKYGVKQLVRQFDAVIDISGYAYGGHWSPKIASRTLAIAEKAKRRGIPYIFLPQAWGPFSNMSAHRSLYRRMCEQGTLLYARDKVSQEELTQLLGKDPSQISRSPDIAFLFQHSGVRKGEALLRQLGLSMDKLIVCISPNCKVYDRFDGFGMQNRYLQSLGSVITCLLGAGVDIVLLPHEIRLSSREIDDRILCEFLRLQTGEPDRVVAVTSMTSSEDLKALIACCDL